MRAESATEVAMPRRKSVHHPLDVHLVQCGEGFLDLGGPARRMMIGIDLSKSGVSRMRP